MGIIGKPHVANGIYLMKVGSMGYTEPDSITIDLHNRWYIDVYSIYLEEKFNDFALPIKRIGTGAGEYELDATGIDYIWWKIEDVTLDDDGNKMKGIVPIGETRLWNSEINELRGKVTTNRVLNSKSTLESVVKLPEGAKKVVDYNPVKYPLTHQLRRELNVAIYRENYENAAKLRDQINQTKEPLTGIQLDAILN